MSVVALRYAHAFSSVVASQKLDADSAQRQLRDFRETLEGSRELREVLADPAISREQKLKVLDALAGRIGMVPQVRTLSRSSWITIGFPIWERFWTSTPAVADEAAGLSEAEIVSARTLTEENRSALETQVAKLAGGRVRATYREDPSLLGGAVVRIGSTVYDGSIRAQLERLKQQLVSAQ